MEQSTPSHPMVQVHVRDLVSHLPWPLHPFSHAPMKFTVSTLMGTGGLIVPCAQLPSCPVCSPLAQVHRPVV